MRSRLLSLISLPLILLVSCSKDPHPDPWKRLQAEDAPRVTATFYPLYDWVNKILGNTYEDGGFITDNLGFCIDFSGNSDPHEFDPSDPSLLAEASDSFLIVSLMDGFDSWSEAIGDGRIPEVKAGEVSGLKDLNGEPIDGFQGSIDPHVWLSPKRAISLFDSISEAVIQNYPDPEAVPELEKNSEEYRKVLVDLDKTYTEALEPHGGELLLTSHEAFSYLCLDYGLEQVGIADFADNIPGPDRLAQIEDLVVEEDIHCIYVESLDSQSAVDVLIEDIGLSNPGYRIEIRELSALESLPYESLMEGEDYVSVMLKNLSEIMAQFGGTTL